MDLLGNLKIEKTTNTLLDMRNSTGSLTTSNTIDLTYGYSSNGINRSSFLMTGRNNSESYKWRTGTQSIQSWGNLGDYRIDELKDFIWHSRLFIGSNTGNVGIGTHTPDSKLHVVGSIKMVDGNEQNDYVLTSDADGVGSWQPWTGGIDKFITGGTYNNSTEKIELTTNTGDVIYVPVNPLVDYDDQTLNLNNNILTISKSNSTVDLSAYINQSNLWTENGANVYRSSGNVGIGTSSPSAKLHITGLFKTTNNGKYITIGNENASYAHFKTDAPSFYFDKTLIVNGGVFKSYDTQDLSLQTSGTNRLGIDGISGEITFNNTYTFPTTDGTVDQVLKTNGSGQLSWTTISAGDTNTDSQDLTFNSGTNILSISGGNNVNLSPLMDDTNHYLDSATMNGNTLELGRNGGLANLTVDLSQFLDDTNLWSENGANIYRNSNVGIGTSSPDTNLHVAGNAIVDTQAWVKNNLIVGDYQTNAQTVEIWNDSLTSLRVGSANNIAAFGTQIMLQRERGTFSSNTPSNVGDVLGRILFMSTSANNYVELSSTHTSTGYDFKIQANTNTDDFYIKGGVGNVGLNTDDPTQKLDVNGKIRMRTGAINGHIPVSDANGVMTWTNPSSVFNDTNTNYYLNSANIAGNTLTLSVNGTSNVNVNLNWTQNGNNLHNANSGNVGIGETAPNSTLEVGGSVSLNYTWDPPNDTMLDDSHYWVLVNTNPSQHNGGKNIKLPTAASCEGRVYVIKNFGTGMVSILPFGSETIDGGNDQLRIEGKMYAVTIASTGVNWFIMNDMKTDVNGADYGVYNTAANVPHAGGYGGA